MSRDADRFTTILTACGWMGLVVFLGWQEFVAEVDREWPTAWWFRVPATLILGLVILVFALECFQQEMTIRRWATSVVVFAGFGILFIAAGILRPAMLELSRWVLIPAGVFYLAAATAAGAGARDVL